MQPAKIMPLVMLFDMADLSTEVYQIKLRVVRVFQIRILKEIPIGLKLQKRLITSECTIL
jgi:hypothetical protein